MSGGSGGIFSHLPRTKAFISFEQCASHVVQSSLSVRAKSPYQRLLLSEDISIPQAAAVKDVVVICFVQLNLGIAPMTATLISLVRRQVE